MALATEGMSSPARQIDRLDTGPRFTAADAERLNTLFAGAKTQDWLRAVLKDKLAGDIAVVSSFGAESAVLLHLVAQIDPDTPVLFLDTGKHFPETLAYRDELVERLGLTNLQILRPDPAKLAERDENGLRWSYDPDGCCEIRKVEPLARAKEGLDSWFSGRKAFQSQTRANLPRFEVEDGRLKVNPLGDWVKADLEAYFEEQNLPRHPLEAQGYLSIGCAPCTSVVAPGEDARAGRWRGWDKVECGIHGEVIRHVDDDPANEPVF